MFNLQYAVSNEPQVTESSTQDAVSNTQTSNTNWQLTNIDGLLTAQGNIPEWLMNELNSHYSAATSPLDQPRMPYNQ